ncbi:hypothetical protein V8E54_014862 [Elaphomyces granulatus]
MPVEDPEKSRPPGRIRRIIGFLSMLYREYKNFQQANANSRTPARIDQGEADHGVIGSHGINSPGITTPEISIGGINLGGISTGGINTGGFNSSGLNSGRLGPIGMGSGGTGHPGVERSNTLRSTRTSEILPATDKLLVFRSLTGIDNAPTLSTIDILGRSAPNLGLYTRVVRAEKRSALEYWIFSTLINACLGLQIIVAASLTAIGAANGPHTLVTLFGAINTVLAGILTYLKGSGMPAKQKHFVQEWTKIRGHIEQREREFCLEACDLDVREEVAIIEKMYDDISGDFQAASAENAFSFGSRDGRSGLTKLPAPAPALRRAEKKGLLDV